MMNDIIKKTVASIDKKWGKGNIVSLVKEDSSVMKCPSGSLKLDEALGGGYPFGRIVEVYGSESSGKTTLAIHACVQAQRMFPDKCIAYIDTEYAFDSDYAQNLGLDLSEDRFMFIQPEHGEQAFDVAETLLKTKMFSVIVFDSVAAMIPRAELEGEMGESKVGLHARLMSQGMRKLTGIVSKTQCLLFFINQLRDKIGVLYGDPSVTTGGNALKFYASQRLDVRRIKTLKEGDDSFANEVRVKVTKNKVAPPFKTAEIVIAFGKGIDSDAETLDVALSSGIIENRGAYYYYEGKRLAQGIANLKILLNSDSGLFEEIKDKIKANINNLNFEENGNIDETDEFSSEDE